MKTSGTVASDLKRRLLKLDEEMNATGVRSKSTKPEMGKAWIEYRDAAFELLIAQIATWNIKSLEYFDVAVDEIYKQYLKIVAVSEMWPKAKGKKND